MWRVWSSFVQKTTRRSLLPQAALKSFVPITFLYGKNVEIKDIVKMNSDDVNDRKRKLSNIIKKITDTQLLKKRVTDSSACSRQDCKFVMNPQERDNEINKAMSIKLLNEKDLSHFAAPVGGFTAAVAGSSKELPATLSEPVGSGSTEPVVAAHILHTPD